MNLKTLLRENSGRTENSASVVSEEGEESESWDDDNFDDNLDDREPTSTKKSEVDARLHEQYQVMINMTMELVRDITIPKRNDEVLTSYGTGVLLTRNGSCGSMEIELPFGAKLYNRQPEMVHKVITPEAYEQAIESHPKTLSEDPPDYPEIKYVQTTW